MPQYALSISMNGSADINSISKQIFCQSEGIEKIIDKNMVIFADQGSSKIADNAVSESSVRDYHRVVFPCRPPNRKRNRSTNLRIPTL